MKTKFETEREIEKLELKTKQAIKKAMYHLEVISQEYQLVDRNEIVYDILQEALIELEEKKE